MVKASRNCPAQRLELSSQEWRSRIQTMLAFCVACHVGTVAVLVGLVLR